MNYMEVESVNKSKDFTVTQLAEMYRDYLNNFLLIATWYASIFHVSTEEDDVISGFFNLCKQAHELGY